MRARPDTPEEQTTSQNSSTNNRRRELMLSLTAARFTEGLLFLLLPYLIVAAGESALAPLYVCFFVAYGICEFVQTLYAQELFLENNQGPKLLAHRLNGYQGPKTKFEIVGEIITLAGIKILVPLVLAYTIPMPFISFTSFALFASAVNLCSQFFGLFYLIRATTININHILHNIFYPDGDALPIFDGFSGTLPHLIHENPDDSPDKFFIGRNSDGETYADFTDYGAPSR